MTVQVFIVIASYDGAIREVTGFGTLALAENYIATHTVRGIVYGIHEIYAEGIEG